VTSPVPTRGLATWSARRPWVVIGGWILVLAAAVAIAVWGLSDVLTQEQSITSSPESVRAEQLLRQSGIPGREQRPATELVIVRSQSLTTDDPAFQDFAAALLSDIRGLTDVQNATSYFETNAPTMASQDGHTVLLPVTLVGSFHDADQHVTELIDLVRARNGSDGFEVLTYGQGSISEAFSSTAEQDLQHAEQRGLPIAFLVLVVVFGAVVAAFVPIAIALAAIGVALGITTIIGQAWELSFFVTNMIFMIGLAVGIDYSLFIVERFREERRRGLAVHEAIGAAGDTASRAVLFSGLTVVIALFGMLLVPSNIFRALSAGAITVVLVALAASLTLLPAVLSVVGDGVNRLALPFFGKGGRVDESRGFWAGAARRVMRYPWIGLVGATLLLAALSVPFVAINLGLSGADTLPRSTMAYRADRILASEFSQGLAARTDIVVTAPDVQAQPVQDAVQALTTSLRNDPRFTDPQTTINPDGSLELVSVSVAGDPAGRDATRAIEDLRDNIAPAAFKGSSAGVLVGGLSASNLDLFHVIDRYTPIVFAFVLSLSFLLLLMVFRSLIVPLKAILMNLLSVGAAYGLLVIVFQEGVGADLFNFQQTDIIQAWIPLFLFTILFGLSMDYHVFLLSRIRERFDETHDNTAAVAFGLRSTANIITGAALIMVVVFSGFALGQMVMFQQVGFGLAVAVLFDATIVRMILVPSAMRLLGDRNWYLPHWLRWLPDLRVEAGSALGRAEGRTQRQAGSPRSSVARQH
jgi:RND superfamily putative drug exporter